MRITPLIHMPKKHNRRTIRLRGFDYASTGAYYVTLNVKYRTPIFGTLRDGVMHLSPIGQIVQDEWLRTPDIRPEVMLDEFIIMPDHMHMIIWIRDVVPLNGGRVQRAPTDDDTIWDACDAPLLRSIHQPNPRDRHEAEHQSIQRELLSQDGGTHQNSHNRINVGVDRGLRRRQMGKHVHVRREGDDRADAHEIGERSVKRQAERFENHIVAHEQRHDQHRHTRCDQLHPASENDMRAQFLTDCENGPKAPGHGGCESEQDSPSEIRIQQFGQIITENPGDTQQADQDSQHQFPSHFGGNAEHRAENDHPNRRCGGQDGSDAARNMLQRPVHESVADAHHQNSGPNQPNQLASFREGMFAKHEIAR